MNKRKRPKNRLKWTIYDIKTLVNNFGYVINKTAAMQLKQVADQQNLSEKDMTSLIKKIVPTKVITINNVEEVLL